MFSRTFSYSRHVRCNGTRCLAAIRGFGLPDLVVTIMVLALLIAFLVPAFAIFCWRLRQGKDDGEAQRALVPTSKRAA